MSVELAVFRNFGRSLRSKLKRVGDNIQPCFTPALQVKDWVNFLSILTADWSFGFHPPYRPPPPPLFHGGVWICMYVRGLSIKVTSPEPERRFLIIKCIIRERNLQDAAGLWIQFAEMYWQKTFPFWFALSSDHRTTYLANKNPRLRLRLLHIHLFQLTLSYFDSWGLRSRSKVCYEHKNDWQYL